MRFISSKVVLALVFLCVFAQAQINPVTNIRWPVATGSVDPVTPTQACGAINYGQPYTNTATGKLFVCAVSGWTAVTSTGSAVFPGSPNLVFNTSTTASRNATHSDVAALFTGCSSGAPALRYDGTCYAPSGSGGSPVVSGSNQYSNNGTTALISGGQFNEEAFNTANNGVATAQGLGITNILVPSTTPSTEDFFGAITVNGSHLHDERGGHVADYYYNTDPGFNAAISQYTYCVDNQAPSAPTVEDHAGCRYTLALFSESGIDETGIPTGWSSDNVETNAFGNGIHQARSTEFLCYTDDDCGANYTYLHVRAANLAGASEGSVLSSFQGFEDGAASGTVTTGGSGAMTIQTSLINGGLANSANIVFPSENIASGTILSYTAGPGDRTLGFVTTSDTHAVSSGYGFFTAGCGTFTVANHPLSAVCPFTTGTLAGHTGFGTFTAGLVSVADWNDPECATATAVGGGNITLNLTKHHPVNTPIYQGTGTCAKLLQGRGSSSAFSQPDGFIPNYVIAGARSPTTWDTLFPFKNGQNGQSQIPLFGPITFPITTAAQTGTTVTLTSSSAAGYLNNYVAPSGASICVSGNSNSAFNVCGITGIVATNGGITLTYTVGSSASNVGTGGTINVGTTGAPTSNGLANYGVYCGALVTKINGVDIHHTKGTGSVDLQANNCTMATSEAFVQPNNPAQSFESVRFGWQAFTPNPIFGANATIELYMQGPAFTGGEYFVVGSTDQISAFQGYGGNETPRTLFNIGDPGIGQLVTMRAPIGVPSSGQVGGTLFNIGTFAPGGVQTLYDLFKMDTAVGSMFLRVDTVNNSLSFLSQGPASTLNIFGHLNFSGVDIQGLSNILVTTGGAYFPARFQTGVSSTLGIGHQAFIAAAGTDNPLLVQGGNGDIQIWKDINVVSPSAAVALGLACPSAGIGVDFHFCTFNGTTWSDRLDIANSTGIVSMPFGMQTLTVKQNTANAPGLQIVTGGGCTTAASLMAPCNVTMTLPVAEPDTAYVVSGCTMNGTAAVMGNISALTTTTFVVAEYSATASAATGGTVACTVTHP